MVKDYVIIIEFSTSFGSQQYQISNHGDGNNYHILKYVIVLMVIMMIITILMIHDVTQSGFTKSEVSYFI